MNYRDFTPEQAGMMRRKIQALLKPLADTMHRMEQRGFPPG